METLLIIVPHNFGNLGNKVNNGNISNHSIHKCTYRGVEKSLARPGRKQANVSVRTARISSGALPAGGGPDDSSRLDDVEIARVPDMLPSLFPSWSG